MKDTRKMVWYAYHNGKWETFETKKQAYKRVLELREQKIDANVEWEVVC